MPRPSRCRTGTASSLAGARAAALPDFIEPCLATHVRIAPSGSAWVHEVKFDGYRLQARIDGESVRLLTRSGQDWTARFSGIARALQDLPAKSALIDGEVVVLSDTGVSSFVALVEALKAGRSERMVFYAFDLLHLDGMDLTGVCLIDRKALLGSLLAGGPQSGVIRFSEHFATDGPAMLAEACRLGLEGIVSKRSDKPYRSGRRHDWLKTKCVAADEFVIGGYLDSKASREAIGALVLGYYDGSRLIYAGRVGTGFTERIASTLWDDLQPLRTDASPFANALLPAQRRGVMWVRPEKVAQIEYRGWTGDNLLRQAAFKAIREDKPARDVGNPRPL